MKRLVLSLVILSFIVTPVFAITSLETDLTTPIEISKDGIKNQEYSIKLIPMADEFEAQYRIFDVDGKNVLDITCKFTDSTLMGSVIGAGAVGKQYIDVIRRAVLTKCKTLYPQLVGTDN